jgi:transposase
MACTVEHRRAADRRGLRYPSDLTDAEWALVAPLIRPAKHGGRPRKVGVREVLNTVVYVLSTGCQWSALPKDRDGAEPLLQQARRLFPFVERIIGDAGYQGPKMAAAVARTGTWKIEIVRRCDRHKFIVLPKRWIVERTIGWISRNHRLAPDFERHGRIAAAFVRMAIADRSATEPRPALQGFSLETGCTEPHSHRHLSLCFQFIKVI